MLKKATLIALIACSIQSCSTLEVAHSDIVLPCVPSHSVYFTQAEVDSIDGDLFDKFEKIILTYKQRIITQCEIAKKYNESYK